MLATIGILFSISTEIAYSGMPCANSLVPSIDPLSIHGHSRNRLKSSLFSSDNQPSAGKLLHQSRL